MVETSKRMHVFLNDKKEPDLYREKGFSLRPIRFVEDWILQFFRGPCYPTHTEGNRI